MSFPGETTKHIVIFPGRIACYLRTCLMGNLGWLEGFEPSSLVPQTSALTTVL